MLTGSFTLTNSREDGPSTHSSVCSFEVSAANNSQRYKANRTETRSPDHPEKQCRNRGLKGKMKDMMETMMACLGKMKETDASLLVEL